MKKTILALPCIFLLFSFGVVRLPAQPKYDIHPKNLDFGPIKIGSSRNLPAVVSCGSDGLMIFQVTSLNTEFSVSPTDGILNPNDSLRFSITFHPASTGPKKGIILFTLNTAAHWDSVLVSGEGSGAEAIEEIQADGLMLSQNYPNPVRDEQRTVIGFALEKESYASIRLYDVLGRFVATVFEGEAVAGKNRTVFGSAANSAGLEPGVYTYVLTAGDKMCARTMVVSR